MNKIIFGLIIGGLLLGGCGTTSKLTTEEKLAQSVVTKTGEIKVKSGDEYLLSTEDGIVNITSNKINLDNYLNKKITVAGMFSGSTLYVDKLEENN